MLPENTQGRPAVVRAGPYRDVVFVPLPFTVVLGYDVAFPGFHCQLGRLYRCAHGSSYTGCRRLLQVLSATKLKI